MEARNVYLSFHGLLLNMFNLEWLVHCDNAEPFFHILLFGSEQQNTSLGYEHAAYLHYNHLIISQTSDVS